MPTGFHHNRAMGLPRIIPHLHRHDLTTIYRQFLEQEVQSSSVSKAVDEKGPRQAQDGRGKGAAGGVGEAARGVGQAVPQAQGIYSRAKQTYQDHWKAVEQALVERIERSDAAKL